MRHCCAVVVVDAVDNVAVMLWYLVDNDEGDVVV